MIDNMHQDIGTKLIKYMELKQLLQLGGLMMSLAEVIQQDETM